MSGGEQFRIDILEATVAVLEARLQAVVDYIDNPDAGYGISPIGVQMIRDIALGESDDFGTPGQLA